MVLSCFNNTASQFTTFYDSNSTSPSLTPVQFYYQVTWEKERIISFILLGLYDETLHTFCSEVWRDFLIVNFSNSVMLLKQSGICM